MQTRATQDELTVGTGAGPVAGTAGRDVRPGWRARLAARLQGDYEEDGTFRPVRLSLWLDVLISVGIVLFMACCFVGFFVWLARTQ